MSQSTESNITSHCESNNQSESDITKKYGQMLSCLEMVEAWSRGLNSEEELISELMFWYCCDRLQQSLDELINAKNKKVK